MQQLVNIYFNSVGMNSVLLLNIPPDKRGRIHEVDAERLNLFGSYIRNTFRNEKLNDGEAAWKARSGASKEFSIQPGETINTVMLQEDIRKGQRVEEFILEGLINNEWVKLAEGTTIGYKRLLKFNDVAPTVLRSQSQKHATLQTLQKWVPIMHRYWKKQPKRCSYQIFPPSRGKSPVTTLLLLTLVSFTR